MQICQLWLVITETVNGMGNAERIGIDANCLNGTKGTILAHPKMMRGGNESNTFFF